MADPIGPWPRRRWTLAMSALLLAGCSAPPPQAPPSSRLQLVTTVLPVTLFTRAVAGSCAEVTPLVPPGGDAHELQARPGELLLLRRARGLVLNGLGLESGLTRLIQAADNPDLVLIDASRGLGEPEASLRLPPVANHQAEGSQSAAGAEPGRAEGGGWADASHPDVSPEPSERDPDGHAHAPDHQEPLRSGQEGAPSDGAHDHHDHGRINPHVWLDPLLAIQQVETIRDGLIRLDPGCADGYRKRAGAYINRLEQLHRDIATLLAPHRGQGLAVFHDLAPWFAERYGLRSAHVVESPQHDPSPLDLERIRQAVQQQRIRVLLSDPSRSEARLRSLARDLNLRLSDFDPLESASEAASRDPSTYLQVMHRNAQALSRALTP